MLISCAADRAALMTRREAYTTNAEATTFPTEFSLCRTSGFCVTAIRSDSAASKAKTPARTRGRASAREILAVRVFIPARTRRVTGLNVKAMAWNPFVLCAGFRISVSRRALQR